MRNLSHAYIYYMYTVFFHIRMRFLHVMEA